MIGLLPLVVIGIVVAVVLTTRRQAAADRPSGGSTGTNAAPGRTPTSQAPPAVGGGVEAALERWTAAGILPPEVRTAIEAFEAAGETAAPGPATSSAPGTRPSRVPFVAEAVGYLGGILTIVAVLVIVSRGWDAIGFPARLALTLAATALAIGAGAVVPEGREPALDRLRWSLWSVGSAAAGATGFVLAERLVASDHARWGHGPTRATGAALGVALASAALWQGRKRPVQAAAALVATLVTVGTLVGRWGDAGPIGTALVVTAAPMVVMGLRRRIPLAIVPLAVGSGATVVGAIVLGAGWSGIGQLVGLALATALTTVALHPTGTTDVPSIAVTGAAGGVLALAVGPGTIGYWAEGAPYPSAVLVFAAGAGLTVLGMARRTRAPRLVQLFGGAALAGAPGLACIERPAVGIVLGLLVAIALLVVGTRPDRTIQSLAGAAGLLAFVPSGIGWFFPGEGRVPLLIGVTGALLVGLAVLLTRRTRPGASV